MKSNVYSDFLDNYITLEEEKEKFKHRTDSFIIKLKETRKLKLKKLWHLNSKKEIE